MTRLIATRKWGLLILFQCIAASVVFLSCDFTRGLDSEGEFDYYEDKPEYLLKGLTDWTNSESFSLDEAEGKVVLVDFWTYTCINCIRTLPWLKDWHHKYSDNGLIMMQRKTEEFSKKEKKLPKKIPNYFTDVKQSNFGWIGNQLVCHDYSFALEKLTSCGGISKRMKSSKELK